MPNSVLVDLGLGRADPAAPLLRADDLGVLRGDGIFETLRVQSGRPVLLREHLDRMTLGAARLALPLPAAAEWHSAVAEALSAYGAAPGLAKLVCTRGPEDGAPVAFVLVTPVPDVVRRGREEGVHAVTLTLGVGPDARRDAPWLLGGVKTTSYAVNMASLREAQSRGADEAIWVAADGTVLEAPTSSVAWVSGGAVLTPPVEEIGVLAGTTLAALVARARLDGVEVTVRRAHVEELRSADEAFLASSVRGVAPLLSLDGQPIGRGGVGPVTAALRRAYEQLCDG